MGGISLLLVVTLSILASSDARKHHNDIALSSDKLSERLYNNIIVGDYDIAVTDSVELENHEKGEIIRGVVDKLLQDSKRNVVEYAYKLWNENAKSIVKQYFPIQFRILVDSNPIKLINKRDGLAMKLGVAEDSYGDRMSYGAGHDKISERVRWRAIPVWNDNRVYFKFVNTQRDQTLKLEKSSDYAGDRMAYGALMDNTNRHQWYLHPVYMESELLFFIFNRQYEQALKLGRDVDNMGDRIVYGHNGNVLGSPELYGWSIVPF